MNVGNYGQSSAPPLYNSLAPSPPVQLSREDRYRAIINKYEITEQFSAKLQMLNSFKIVFVFDDSGSMSSTLNESPLNTGLMKVGQI